MDINPDLRNLRLLMTYPHPCSYLENQQATTLFIDPQESIDIVDYARLSEVGFRRSGDHFYRPNCMTCRACIPARIPVDRFRPTRNQKRTLSRNDDLTVIQIEDLSDPDVYPLYERYINERHQDGDMYPPSFAQLESFLTKKEGCTHYFGFYRHDKLVSVAVTDVLPNGVSAIYTFYDPAEEPNSIGRYCILWQIELCKQLDLPHVYLGYWIKDCRKMSYKSQYRPLELLVNGHWVQLL